MQERALRALFLNKQSSYKVPLDKGDLQNRRLYKVLNTNYVPRKFPSYFMCIVHLTDLRVAVFAIPRFKTKKYDKHWLTYLGPRLRNRLPGEIRTLANNSDEF